jgi:hypothetical protein
VAIVGAQLGNIAGIGQTRHHVGSSKSAAVGAASLLTEFHRIGLPFLQRYSDAGKVVEVLQSGGAEAGLISPVRSLHAAQISALLAFSTEPVIRPRLRAHDKL